MSDREAFEKWYMSRGWVDTFDPLMKHDHGAYIVTETCEAWEAWQAALQSGESSRAMLDAVTHGTGITKGGKHVPLEDFYVQHSGEPVGWQFYESGKWYYGMPDMPKDHRANTEAAGIPVRDLYTTPQPVMPQGFNQFAHNRSTGEWLYKNHADEWQNCPAPFHAPQPVVPEGRSDIGSLLWTIEEYGGAMTSYAMSENPHFKEVADKRMAEIKSMLSAGKGGEQP